MTKIFIFTTLMAILASGCTDKSRTEKEISNDLQALIQHCTSVNKHTVREDMASCTAHMSNELAGKKQLEWKNAGYQAIIEKIGCEKTRYVFGDVEGSVKKDDSTKGVEANVTGEVTCISQAKRISSEKFNLTIKADLVAKDATHPLGVIINSYKEQ